MLINYTILSTHQNFISLKTVVEKYQQKKFYKSKGSLWQGGPY